MWLRCLIKLSKLVNKTTINLLLEKYIPRIAHEAAFPRCAFEGRMKKMFP